MNKLDNKDLHLLSVLDWNARMPITQIAKRVQLNKDVVRYRIKNLEEQGIIKGYYSLIDLNKLGYITFRGYFQETAREVCRCARMDRCGSSIGRSPQLEGEVRPDAAGYISQDFAGQAPAARTKASNRARCLFRRTRVSGCH